MAGELDKIVALLSGNQTIYNKLIEKQTKAISDLAEAVKNQKITVTAPDVKINFADLKVPTLNLPEIKLPTINVPESKVKVEIPPIKVPAPEVTVNVPEQKAPIVNVPAPIVNIPEFPKEIEVKGFGGFIKVVVEAVKNIAAYSLWNDVSRENPVPVVLVTPDGKTYTARSGSVSFAGGAGFETNGLPAGFEQVTVSTAAVGINVPTGATSAVITVETDNIRWRDDGTNPTSTVGMFTMQTQSFELSSTRSLTQFKAIRDTAAATDATLNISYYKKP